MKFFNRPTLNTYFIFKSKEEPTQTHFIFKKNIIRFRYIPSHRDPENMVYVEFLMRDEQKIGFNVKRDEWSVALKGMPDPEFVTFEFLAPTNSRSDDRG